MKILCLVTLLLIPGLAQAAFLDDATQRAKYLYAYARYGSLDNAAKKGDVEGVKTLIAYGHEVNPKVLPFGDRTPLHRAQNVEVTRELINAGADVNAKDVNGYTPLHYAAQRGDVESIRELFKSGAQFDQQFNPLFVAKTGKVVDELVKGGANPNALDRGGNSPIHYAQNAEVVKALVIAGADIKGNYGYWGETPLHNAQNADVARALIEAGANPNAEDFSKRTPLHEATRVARGDVIEELLKAGSQIDSQDESGRTVLHTAADGMSLELVKKLINAGANPSIKDKAGKTPADYARYEEIKELLKSAR